MNAPSASPAPTPDRNALALQRTALANERTLLAYVRTGIMLGASGVTLLKLGGEMGYERPLAASLLFASAAVFALGIRRFRSVAAALRNGSA
ncbi:MAG: DUF202 domain-containing protein [Planctomycetota bacterium]